MAAAGTQKVGLRLTKYIQIVQVIAIPMVLDCNTVVEVSHCWKPEAHLRCHFLEVILQQVARVAFSQAQYILGGSLREVHLGTAPHPRCRHCSQVVAPAGSSHLTAHADRGIQPLVPIRNRLLVATLHAERPDPLQQLRRKPNQRTEISFRRIPSRQQAEIVDKQVRIDEPRNPESELLEWLVLTVSADGIQRIIALCLAAKLTLIS